MAGIRSESDVVLSKTSHFSSSQRSQSQAFTTNLKNRERERDRSRASTPTQLTTTKKVTFSSTLRKSSTGSTSGKIPTLNKNLSSSALDLGQMHNHEVSFNREHFSRPLSPLLVENYQHNLARDPRGSRIGGVPMITKSQRKPNKIRGREIDSREMRDHRNELSRELSRESDQDQVQHPAQVISKPAQDPDPVFSRWYQYQPCMRSLNLCGLAANKFPSLKVCVFQNFYTNNKSIRCLHLGFDRQHKAGMEDFTRAARLEISKNNFIDAMNPEKLDDNGYYVPKVEQRIVLDGVPYQFCRMGRSLADNLEMLGIADVFLDSMIFGSGRKTASSIYSGQISFRVKKFMNIPMPTEMIRMRMVNGSNITEIFVRTKCIGVSGTEDRNARPHMPNLGQKMGPGLIPFQTHQMHGVPANYCFCCKQPGHIAKNCPSKKQMKFAWYCNKCRSKTNNCNENLCLGFLAKPKLITPNMKEPSKKWDPTAIRKLIDPSSISPAQTILCLQNSVSAKEIFKSGDVELTVEHVQKWVSYKLQEDFDMRLLARQRRGEAQKTSEDSSISFNMNAMAIQARPRKGSRPTSLTVPIRSSVYGLQKSPPGSPLSPNLIPRPSPLNRIRNNSTSKGEDESETSSSVSRSVVFNL